jgi:hypothetical protein
MTTGSQDTMVREWGKEGRREARVMMRRGVR